MSRNKVISAVIAAAVVAAGAGAYAWRQARGAAPDYRLAKVERGSITAAVSATGTVNPVTVVQVGSQVSGQLKEVLVDFNSMVKKGQIIARIDPDSFALRVNQAMADVEAARATVLTQRANVAALYAEVSRARVGLADAEREFQRNKMLHEKNFVSAAALDKAEFSYRTAQEQVKVAQAHLAVGESQVRNVEALVKQRDSQLSQAKVDLDRTTIRAPVDGIVIKKSVEPGQTVAASLQAPELFVIAQDLRNMQVDTSIDEAEVGRIREGQSATFTVDSFPGRTFRGTVGQVRKAALVVQNVVTYTAVIATSNPNLELFPGMTANVRIVVDTRQNALKVPNAALRFRPAGVAEARDSGGAGDPGGAAAPERTSDKGGSGQQAGAAARERLVKELNLNAEQQAKLEAIMNETRDRIRAIETEDKGERRKRAERLRAESRARIAEMLNPEQRKRYEETTPGRAGGRRTAASGRVWMLDDNGNPKAVNLRTGLADSTYSEVVGGGLQEGSQVIVGTRTDAKVARSQPKGGPRFGF
ncbi:MAG: efflux RND transporter periplasmic adaptor subunit [Betaproteobacteria bacterium]|nr:efflux RND transporter periplasmic adaptor subunit [Betaproteobacteria bacterium]